MFEITQISVPILLIVFISLTLIQLAVFVGMAISFRRFSRKYNALAKEMFGLVRRLEVLTATRREQIVKHYDRLISKLASRLPPTIAGNLGKTIFDTESRILSRLAELEPQAQMDPKQRKKMEELIKSMERLEQTLVALTSDTVQSVMLESRADLINEERFLEDHLAA